ncbi:hypothetical protein [Streptomyces sp. NPDC058268]|uniref:hypothetical protein n=1 Tax=Streptomyces sp. NPDC058268 TaxID=3346413 RepID=UPI0036EF8185
MPQYLRAEDVQVAYAAGVRAAHINDSFDRALALLIAHGRNDVRAQIPGLYCDPDDAAHQMNTETTAGYQFIRATRYQDFGATGAEPGPASGFEGELG